MLADWKSQSMILCVLVSSRMQKSIVFEKDTLCYKITNIMYGHRKQKKNRKKLHLNFLRDKSFVLNIVTGDILTRNQMTCTFSEYKVI